MSQFASRFNIQISLAKRSVAMGLTISPFVVCVFCSTKPFAFTVCSLTADLSKMLCGKVFLFSELPLLGNHGYLYPQIRKVVWCSWPQLRTPFTQHIGELTRLAELPDALNDSSWIRREGGEPAALRYLFDHPFNGVGQLTNGW